jgi:hypothetical protein
MDQENIDYLNRIAERMTEYDNVRGEVVSYILQNSIKDIALCTDLFIIGFLYKAYHRNEVITEEELAVLLGDSNDQDETFSKNAIVLSEEKSELSFGELLDSTVENYQC